MSRPELLVQGSIASVTSFETQKAQKGTKVARYGLLCPFVPFVFQMMSNVVLW